MGNAQDRQGRRDRGGGADGNLFRPRAYSSSMDDECPVQVKIAKSGAAGGGDSSNSSVPSMQYKDTQDLPVVIKWTGQANVKSVAICGSWDCWGKKLPLVKSHEDFTTIINLPEGRHEFKFYVDGVWLCDPNIGKTDNKVGSQNNVVTIDRADFHVFDALDKDMQSTSSEVGGRGNTGPNDSESVNERELEKLKAFSQEVPDRTDFERAHNPPVLPPHLLQVILNKDTPVQCDPNVLPEPNHVMLNHLYALSIKDGVMVLSATHRYRKKYVTTLLYKPI